MSLSPMMEQYMKTKQENPGTLLFYRLGDFYEMFFDDAKTAARELDLVLTGRDCGLEEKAPMCGVPFHSADSYIARLVAKGYKVAICEQMEEASEAKGLVRREVVRICTPGTAIDSSMLDEGKNNYLCTVIKRSGVYGLCFADASTGQFHVMFSDSVSRVIAEISKFSPSEMILNIEAKTDKKIVEYIKLASHLSVNEDASNVDDLLNSAKEYFDISELDLIDKPTAIEALGATILYLKNTQRTEKINVSSVEVLGAEKNMSLDPTARRNLELTEALFQKGTKGTLLWVLDKTKTAPGKRLLRAVVEQPLLSVKDILARQNAVAEMYSDTRLRVEITELLSGINDFERILTRVVYGTANAKELKTLSQAFRYLPHIKSLLASTSSNALKDIYENIDELNDVADIIDAALVDEPPLSVRDGGMIRAGYNDELDELVSIVTGGKDYLAKIEEERQRTGIPKLKIGYNRVFGYYIEVTNSYKDMVPEDYTRKQTLTNSERFITGELKDIESKVLGAKERIDRLEFEIFTAIRERVAGEKIRIEKTAHNIANLDVFCSLAATAVENGFVRPDVDMSDEIIIEDGFHPVVAKALDPSSPFVPNDTRLNSKDCKIALVTGPNMAGKSTYMRQVALIVILAQIGSFVPAKSAKIGIVDNIFTRVGASDDLMAGKSTFMTEMLEVSSILKHATKRSLIILDEVGRGTSTFDGMSIAQAVIEYIALKIGAKTMFATHYHELTDLEGQIPGLKNFTIAVKKRKDEIIFLRKIIEGPADGSYGIDVAKLADLPKEVLKRARTILRDLEKIDFGTREIRVGEIDDFDEQTTLEDNAKEDIINELKLIEPYSMNPIEALSYLNELKERVKTL